MGRQQHSSWVNIPELANYTVDAARTVLQEYEVRTDNVLFSLKFDCLFVVLLICIFSF